MTRSRCWWAQPKRMFTVLLLVVCFGFRVPSAFAQAPNVGTLYVTVVDFTGAIIPRATVSVARAEGGPAAATFEPVETSDTGVAAISGLVPGRYSVQAEFPGFETRLLKDVRVQAGENKQVVLLTIQKVETSVTVDIVVTDATAAADQEVTVTATGGKAKDETKLKLKIKQ